MRATWYTSLIAGGLFAALAIAAQSTKGALVQSSLIIAFFATSLIGVIGIAQIREMNEERRRRHLGFLGAMADRTDFLRFYFPTWTRLLLWLCGVMIAMAVSKVFFE